MSRLLPMTNAYGLYTLHIPSILLPAPEYFGGTIPVTRLAIEALQQLGQLGAIDPNATRTSVMQYYSAMNKQFALSYGNSPKTTLATADALQILAIIGFPAGFAAGEIPGIVEQYSRKQLPGGGWAMDDGAPLAVTGHCARIVTALVEVAGTTGTVDLGKIRSLLASSLAHNAAAGMAAYCPYPANHPNLPAAEGLVLLAARHGMLDPGAETAARQLVAAGLSDGSGTYPRKYPDVLDLAYHTGGEFRTYGTGGIAMLAAQVALRDALSVPFTQADLNLIDDVLSGIQYTSTTIPGLQGLCLTLTTWARCCPYRA